MRVILVTGGTGTLGQAFVTRVQAAGHTARIMSRQPRPTDLPPNQDWVQADLATGAGLDTALKDVDAVLHAATASGFGNFKEIDVIGTQRLLNVAARFPIRHFLFPSIVGVDQIPQGYYTAKHRSESDVLESAVPATVVRATQFHAFVAQILQMLGKLPLMPVPAGFQVQSVSVDEVADLLFERILGEPVGMAPDIAGPEILTLPEMAREWAQMRQKHRWVLSLPLPGKTARAFRTGRATNPNRAVGKLRWGDWLRHSA